MGCRLQVIQRITSILIALVISSSGVADQLEHAQITVGYWRTALPPYIMVGKDNGIFVDMVRKSFANQRVNTTSQYFSTLEKSVKAMEEGHIDALAMGTIDLGEAYYYSDPIFVFDNHAISLQKNNLRFIDLFNLG